MAEEMLANAIDWAMAMTREIHTGPNGRQTAAKGVLQGVLRLVHQPPTPTPPPSTPSNMLLLVSPQACLLLSPPLLQVTARPPAPEPLQPPSASQSPPPSVLPPTYAPPSSSPSPGARLESVPASPPSLVTLATGSLVGKLNMIVLQVNNTEMMEAQRAKSKPERAKAARSTKKPPASMPSPASPLSPASQPHPVPAPSPTPSHVFPPFRWARRPPRVGPLEASRAQLRKTAVRSNKTAEKTLHFDSYEKGEMKAAGEQQSPERVQMIRVQKELADKNRLLMEQERQHSVLWLQLAGKESLLVKHTKQIQDLEANYTKQIDKLNKDLQSSHANAEQERVHSNKTENLLAVHVKEVNTLKEELQFARRKSWESRVAVEKERSRSAEQSMQINALKQQLTDLHKERVHSNETENLLAVHVKDVNTLKEELRRKSWESRAAVEQERSRSSEQAMQINALKQQLTDLHKEAAMAREKLSKEAETARAEAKFALTQKIEAEAKAREQAMRQAEEEAKAEAAAAQAKAGEQAMRQAEEKVKAEKAAAAAASVDAAAQNAQRTCTDVKPTLKGGW
eukprot:CAMPEP_0119344968 /NCGR_PEP_ID=MMETSP1333-20130426/107243_1 /TAXON_ID=418940 /ORGANISM="Scyphosphaera apsteinii, Strain RCC1455" /LENGTH=567 /DNA_ID=CAMNT_0007357419 /DNA_START=209 /DNA_END=1909 /DNA_ORIENTATION=-